MGLDIYLYSREEEAANKAHSQGWDDAYNEHHDSETGILKTGHTEEMWNASREAVPPYGGSADLPSEAYPNHLFKRNYLRSSYNDSGFNRAVPDMLGRAEGGLYWIFQPVIEDREEPYETDMDAAFIPKLEATKARALSVAQELKDSDPLRAMRVSGPMLGSREHMWDHLPTEDEVLAWYREELEKRKESLASASRMDREEYGYSSAKGEVFGFDKGMEILAVTLGANPLSGFSQQFPTGTLGSQMGIMPQAILVYRMKDDGKESYIQSAEIIGEFCDYAIELIKRDGSCMMNWSG